MIRRELANEVSAGHRRPVNRLLRRFPTVCSEMQAALGHNRFAGRMISAIDEDSCHRP